MAAGGRLISDVRTYWFPPSAYLGSTIHIISNLPTLYIINMPLFSSDFLQSVELRELSEV